MSDNIKMSFRLEGAEELTTKLLALESKVHNRIARNAVRESGKVLLKASKDSAKSMVGGKMGRKLASAMSLRKQKKRLPKFVYAMNILFSTSGRGEGLRYHAKGAHTNVDFEYVDKHGSKRRKIGATEGVSFIPSAIEYGHGANKDKAAIPFMRTAFKRTAAEVTAKLGKALRDGIEQEGRK